ncbi:MAG: putative DNA-binding domain-containing protein [Sphingopyxis sp.]|nr:putative DNA-binding domain-containing protein [Sphingopyxis sp.]
MAEALRAVQALFLAGVTGGDAGAEALIVDDNRVGAARRLDIYRNNYRASLTGVLADHFERVHAWLGDDQFDNVAGAYIDRHPSRTRNLRHYGEEFPAFLAHHYPDDGELAELAALDWALRGSFDAADAVPLDAEQVDSLRDDWIERPLMLHPSAQLLTQHHNSRAIWSALDADETPPDAAPLAGQLILLVWRLGTQSQFRTLGDDEARALRMLAAGASFTDLSVEAIDRLGEAAAMEALAGWLGRWLADEVLILAD